MRDLARFVLVHGAFAGGWCWDAVIEPLEAAGHSVSAPDLPGSGDDHTPVDAVTLSLYADHVCAELARTAEPAILVGHSMGGVVITQAAARCRERVSLLVYVAAFLPRDGQSLIDLTRLPEGAEDQVQANLTIEGDPPVGALSERAQAHALFNCATNRQLRWALERTRPQPLAPFLAPVELDGRDVAATERVYIRCTKDHAIPPALQARMVAERPCVELHEIDTDHSPFISRPAELARLLTGVAERSATGRLGQPASASPQA
jgi:pimeloyl-ACP methyl ester carboxylesterase